MSAQYKTLDERPSQPGEDIISDPSEIAKILLDIRRHQIAVNVRLDPDGPLYDSKLYRLDAGKSMLILERLVPTSDASLVARGQMLLVFASMRSAAIRFSLRIVDIVSRGTGPLYLSRFPDTLLSLQRRNTFRVRIPLGDQRMISIRRPGSRQTLSARILDLSINGFCLQIPEGQIDPSHVGSAFTYFDMDLPETKSRLSGDAILVNVRPSSSPGFLSAGFAITAQDPAVEQSIMRAALYYQREARKLK